jgi:hypothetical protein
MLYLRHSGFANTSRFGIAAGSAELALLGLFGVIGLQLRSGNMSRMHWQLAAAEVGCWWAIALPIHNLAGIAYVGDGPVGSALYMPILFLILCFVVLMLIAAGFIAGANGTKLAGAVGVVIGCASGAWLATGTLLGAVGGVFLLAAVAALIVPRLLEPVYGPPSDGDEWP